MNSTQLSLLPDECSPLDESIGKIRSKGTRHPNYVRFVRMVATSAVGLRPGSVVLCAALSDFDAEEICSDITKFIQDASEKQTGSSAGVCMVDTPHALRAREMRAALVEAYHRANATFCAGHRSGPRFALDGPPAYLGQNHAQRIAALIEHREPMFYLFRNIHLLQRIDSQPSDAMEFVRMFTHIADLSRRTHILLGNAATVLRWLNTGEITESVIPVLLEPYYFEADEDKPSFLSILAAYDGCIPWEKGLRLADQAEYITNIVQGSPHRLRKWLLNALCRARASGQTELTWNCLVAAAPSPGEKAQITKETDLIRKFCGRPEINPNPVTSPKRALPPGTRNLGRDVYAA